jgi:transcriptional regulator with XRE-family HTH domain
MPRKDRLKQLRTAAGMTQQELASKAGLSISGVVQIELRTVPDPRVSNLRALGVTLDEVAGRAEGAGPEQQEEPPTGPKKRRQLRKGE